MDTNNQYNYRMQVNKGRIFIVVFTLSGTDFKKRQKMSKINKKRLFCLSKNRAKRGPFFEKTW